MQKITQALFLSVCLGITTSSLAMEDQGEEVKDSREPLARAVKEEVKNSQKPLFTISETTAIPYYEPSPVKTFFRKNWLPILGFTSLTAYCLYDRKALSETFAWSSNLWQSLPRLVKGLCIGGGVFGTLRYLFSKPALCNNPEHNKYLTKEEFASYKRFNKATRQIRQDALQESDKPVNTPESSKPQEKEELAKQGHSECMTRKEFGRYKDILEQQLHMAEMMQQNPEQFFQMLHGSDENFTDLPTPQQLGNLFNSDKDNKTRVS